MKHEFANCPVRDCSVCHPQRIPNRITVDVSITVRLNEDASRLIRTAANLIGPLNSVVNGEYTRGMLELIADTTTIEGVDTDQKREVIHRAIMNERRRQAAA